MDGLESERGESDRDDSGLETGVETGLDPGSETQDSEPTAHEVNIEEPEEKEIESEEPESGDLEQADLEPASQETTHGEAELEEPPELDTKANLEEQDREELSEEHAGSHESGEVTPDEPEGKSEEREEERKEPEELEEEREEDETKEASETPEGLQSGEPAEHGDSDFGDFDDFEEFDDDDFVQAEPLQSEPSATSTVPTAPSRRHVPFLAETDFVNSATLQAAVLATIRKSSGSSAVEAAKSNTAPQEKTSPGSYFSERSISLWNQLVVEDPHMQPLDWKRSSIRRLFFLSLGIPLDLDEILPKKNTKRLVLPMAGKRSAGSSPRPSTDSNGTSGSKARTHRSKDSQSRRDRQILSQETESKVSSYHQMAAVSEAALEGMSEPELETHVAELRKAEEDARALLTQWTELKQAAAQDKEAFEGVIESLLEYAQRLKRRAK